MEVRSVDEVEGEAFGRLIGNPGARRRKLLGEPGVRVTSELASVVPGIRSFYVADPTACRSSSSSEDVPGTART